MNRQTGKAPRAWPIGLGLAMITFAVFTPALTYPFLTYDDQQYVSENRHVQGGLSWAGMVWASKSLYASNWHPLTWLSHMLDWQCYGPYAPGHHLTNVLLHVANTVLLFLVLQRMTGARWRSACVAALFAWHPLHVESVAWIAERKDVLSGLFFMLTLWAYVQSPKSRVPSPESRVPSPEFKVQGSKPEVPGSRFKVQSYYALALLCFALGLMSKGMLVTVPFVLLLLDYWPLERFQIKNQKSKIKNFAALLWEKIPFLALAVGGCVLTILAQGHSSSLASMAGLPLVRRVRHALVAYMHYLGAAFVPRHLAVFYPYPEHEGWAEIAGAGLLLVLVTVLVVRFGARRPYLPVGWFWFLGMLVPVIGLVQVGDQAWADRYTYLPLIGLFIMIVWGMGEVLGCESSVGLAGMRPKPGWSLLAAGLACAIGAACIAGTVAELRWWKDTRTLFERALQVTQRNARATTMVGTFLAEEGKLNEAIGYYRLALTYRPDDPEAHFFLGRAYDAQGRLEAAAGEYSQALWFTPLQEKTHICLGVLRARQGLSDQAAEHYRAALAINPESASAENDLARLLHSQGKLDEAIAHYSAALRFDPNLAQAHNNLGVLLLQKGRLAEGTAQLREAIRLNPGDPETQFNLGSALNQQQQWQAAVELLAKAAPARPQDANLHYQFALALAHTGQTKDAMSHYAQALLLHPDFPEALDGLSWILATDPRPEVRNADQALQMSSLACDLTARKQPALLATLAAAQAEKGQFVEATATAHTAQNLASAAGQRDLAAKCQAMADTFKAGKPWRDAGSGR